MKLSLKLAKIFALIGLITTITAAAKSQLRLVNPEPGTNDRFGNAMASNGTTNAGNVVRFSLPLSQFRDGFE